MHGENTMTIPAELRSAAQGGVVTSAEGVFDYTKGKSQEAVNADIDTALDDRYTKSETYSKTELNNLITTPNQEYVTVADYASLPATGSADTIYRVSSYDGEQEQVDATKYSEYAWDGTQYAFLSVKSAIGEVFDISEYHSGTTYADLAAALDGGNNVPEGIRKGGMSVKFVQTSDNKYVQFRLMAQSFTTDVTKWQGVDDEPTIDSDNLVKSGGVLVKSLQDILNWDNTIMLSTDEQNSGWLPLPTPINKDIFVFAADVDPNNTMAIAMSGDGGTTIAFQLNITNTQRYITIPQGVESPLTHWRLWSSAAVKKTVKVGYIDNFQELIFSRLTENLNVENTYQDGYWDDNATWVSGGGWRSFTFNTVQGHNYLIYCATGTNIVDIDSNAVASINIGGVMSAKGAINLGYRIVKANGVKLGASLRTSISKMYYIDLDTYSGTSLTREILRIISNTDGTLTTLINQSVAALVTSLNKLNIKNDCDNTITSFSDVLNGFAYNEDGELIQAGGWHVAFIDVVVNRYYLIKTCNSNTIRIVNVDANKDFVSVNGSVPIDWYQGSASTESYVFVKASSAKLAITYHNNSSDVRITPITDNSPYTALINTINKTSGSPEYTVDINGGGDFTSFMECLLSTNDQKNRIIYLKPGIYDVIEELKAYYGSTYWEDYVYSSSNRGPELKNNVTVVGCENAVIQCHYSGNNADVNSRFSPLNGITDSFTLIGVNVDAKNVRYCVHDEHTSTTPVYTSSYEKCSFILDNSNNPNWHQHHCIGMGLGVNGTINIIDNLFKTVGTIGNTGALYIHNSAADTACSMVVIRGNYFDGDQSMQLHYYGSSTKITKFLVSNNSVGSIIEVGPETEETINNNIDVKEWNNVVRTQ